MNDHINDYPSLYRNSLTIEQCIDNPETAGTVLCQDYQYSYPVEICLQYPRIASLKVCEGK